MRPSCSLVLLCLLPAAIAAAPSTPTPPRPPRIALSELSFAGIVLGDTQAKVKKTLGKPGETIGQPDDHDYIFRYPGLDITFFDEDKVAGLSSTSPRRCTPSGVCPGQTLAQAHARLGRGAPPAPVDDAVEYYVEDESCWLQLNLDADSAPPQRIKTLSVVCIP
ncbi:hypothetical protein [Lysobacter sp. CA199]|uniref:hypothetical protein n=1 Tax=Lysobacter sp. CA199 TaxID=3455608 RepID=UPI003F8D17FC